MRRVEKSPMFTPSTTELRLLQRTQVHSRGFQVTPLQRGVVAYALPSRKAVVAECPREVLGVAHDADQQEIKTAFRRLALEHHPDREGGNGQHFMEILRAYEILVGKSDGKEGLSQGDWDFHDWYWKFTMSRSKGNSQSRASHFQADLPSQLAGLRQRAAVRAAKARAAQSTSVYATSEPDEDFEDCEESPSDSGVTSEAATFDQSARYAEEARRRANLNSSEMKESISSQLTGLKRRASIRMEL